MNVGKVRSRLMYTLLPVAWVSFLWMGFVDAFPSRAQPTGKLLLKTPEADIVKNRVVFGTTRGKILAAKSITLTNSGSGPLTINSLLLGNSEEAANAVSGRTGDYQRPGDFQILNTPALPSTLAPGASLNLSIQFAPQRVSSVISGSPTHTTNGENYATLTINSDDPTLPSAKVQLAGLNAANFEGSFEPAIAEIARTFGFGTVVGSESINPSGAKKWLGEEVYSPYWVRADSSKPVYVWPLGRYAGRSTNVSGYTNYYAKAGTNGNNSSIYAFVGGTDENGGENQKLLPNVTLDFGATSVTPSTGNTAEYPNSAFTLYHVDTYTDDTLNKPDLLHNWRLYPARDSLGRLIANSWYAVADPGNVQPGPSNPKNFDYNDGVFLLTNARPENSGLDPAVVAPAPGASKLVLYFRSSVSNSLVDANGQGLGFLSAQRNSSDTFSSVVSYDPNLLRLDFSNTGTLNVTTTNSSPSRTDNTLVNGLQLAFDGRSIPFTASAKILGPLSQLNTPPYQQAGIFLGPDQDNFVKVVGRATAPGAVGVEFYQERRAVGTSLSTITLTDPASLQSLEVFLIADPTAGTVRAAYRAIYPTFDTGQVLLPGTVTLAGADKGRYFDRRSRAGIMAYSKDAPAVQVVYDNFQVLKSAP